MNTIKSFIELVCNISLKRCRQWLRRVLRFKFAKFSVPCNLRSMYNKIHKPHMLLRRKGPARCCISFDPNSRHLRQVRAQTKSHILWLLRSLLPPRRVTPDLPSPHTSLFLRARHQSSSVLSSMYIPADGITWHLPRPIILCLPNAVLVNRFKHPISSRVL